MPQAAAASPEDPKPEQAGHPDRLACKKFAPHIGSRMRQRRICKTETEWALIEQEQRDALDQVQSRKFNR